MSVDAAKRARFEALARRHGTDLLRFGLWLCGNETVVQDVLQETLLRAWRALDSLKDDDAARSWLITIFRREYARTFERKRLPLSEVDLTLVEDPFNPSPEDQAEREVLRHGILSLDRRYREPLLLQVVMGYSVREIARELEVTESAVMTQLFRAREQLKDKLQDDGSNDNVHGLF